MRPVLHRVAARYPAEMAGEQHADVDRMAHQLSHVYEPGARLADLGGGLGLLSPAAAALGMDSHLVDDLRDPIAHEHPIDGLGVHAELGVRIVRTPVLEWGRHFADASLDVVTCVDSLEHWHHSPRPVLAEALRVLRPGGLLLLGGPNAVNLRKRVAVPLGRSNWSHFEDWFYPEEFRGHVREPTLGELVRMVEEVGFVTERAWGRNWMPYPTPAGARRLVHRAIDRALRPFPTLCSDLYVLARRPEAA